MNNYSLHVYIEEYGDRSIHILTHCKVECTDIESVAEL